ncbi:putative efflux pump antibiotic resistance protein [Hypoxylon cercidicola]|nr:putative efflux pump antibiotic resistance protein [Hypoxylon cercidicola]
MEVLASSDPPPKASAQTQQLEKPAALEAINKPHNVDHGVPSAVQEDTAYLQGFRFWAVSVVIAVLLFLVNLETTVVTTALVAITNDLGNFDIVSWVLSSYLLGYVGFIVLSAKLSDIFGRKQIILLCAALFTVFSGGCGAAASMPQIIILRAFQGLGGGGCFALSTVLIIELVPPKSYAKYVAYTGIVIVVAAVLGPIIGGVISSNISWRWIFLINVPIGAFTFVLALIGIPNGFPIVDKALTNATTTVSFKQCIARLDIMGSILLLLASLSLTAAFEQVGSRFYWDSALILSLLLVSAALWAALLFWERRVSKLDGVCEPVLPWQFLTNRSMVGMLLGFFLLGGPITVTVFQLPQRFQLVNGLSGLDAGVRMLPFAVGVTVGSSVGARIADQFQTSTIFVVIAGSILQVIGLVLLSYLSTSVAIPSELYGYLVLIGFGCGINYSTLYLMIPITVHSRDRAVGMGTGNQFRMMGSAVSLAIATTVFRSFTEPTFERLGIDASAQTNVALDLSVLSLESREELRSILALGYNRQMIVLSGFAAAQIPAALLMWKRGKFQTEW